MTESDEPKPRPRWFQFDLRLLFVVIAAIGVILALEVARGSRAKHRKLLNTLSVGDLVLVYVTDDGRVTIYYDDIRTYSYQGTITEVGDDFVAIRRDYDQLEAFIPLARLDGVRRGVPSEPAIGNNPPPPTKTLVKTKNVPISRQRSKLSP